MNAQLDQAGGENPGLVHFLHLEWLGWAHQQTMNATGLIPTEVWRSQRPWVALITGVDSVYGLKRQFIKGYLDVSGANYSGDKGVMVHFLVEEGKLYEANYPVSRKKSERSFLTHDGSTIKYLSIEEGLAWARTISE